MVGMCIMAVAARHTAWAATYRRLAAGAAIGAVLPLITRSAMADGTSRIGTFNDFAWIAPFLLYAWAAKQAPVSPQAEEASERTSTLATLSAMPVLLIPILGYFALPLNSSAPEVATFRALLTGMATVGGLGLLRSGSSCSATSCSGPTRSPACSARRPNRPAT